LEMRATSGSQESRSPLDEETSLSGSLKLLK
jgi:hypothetical protein